MSAMTLPVPDLAPSLGRLIVPRRLHPLWVPIDDVRELLATRVMEQGGEARATAARGATVQALAKVGRDRMMVELDALFPGYGFARHKGYPTPEHLEALQRLGPCPVHRRSFAPVAAVLVRMQVKLPI